MITLNVERGLVRLLSWDDMFETPGFRRDIDPKQIELKEIIGVYTFSSKQPCGLKTCRQPHSNGYLVSTIDGQVTNIGNVCGRKNFLVAFTDLKRSFDRELIAKERRERLESIKSRVQNILSSIETLKAGVAPYHRAIRQILGDSGSLPRSIVDAVREMRRNGDGAIFVARRSTKEERDRALTTGNARADAPYYVRELKGRLTNIGSISATGSIRSTLHELEPALLKLQDSDVGKLSDKEARSIDKVTSGIDSKLDRLQFDASSITTFVTKTNLTQLGALLDSSADRKIFNEFLASLPVPK